MVDRLRALLDRPLDSTATRAILVFASAILLGLAALFAFAATEPDQPSSREYRPAATAPLIPAAPLEPAAGEAVEHRAPGRRQDPQDEVGSTAARAAARALRSHRALQQVPYRSGEVTITLVGARHNRALLSVSASTVSAAQRAWHRFLRRYRDSGGAYVPVFKSTKARADG